MKKLGRHVIAVLYPKVFGIFDEPYNDEVGVVTATGSWRPEGDYPVNISWAETRAWPGVESMEVA